MGFRSPKLITAARQRPDHKYVVRNVRQKIWPPLATRFMPKR